MKTTILRSDGGVAIGFRVSALFLGRHGVPRIIAAIPSAEIKRRQARFSFSRRDDFCEFVVDGRTFLALEPFGDNGEFWIVAEPPMECPQIEIVRSAFEKHRCLFGLYAG